MFLKLFLFLFFFCDLAVGQKENHCGPQVAGSIFPFTKRKENLIFTGNFLE